MSIFSRLLGYLPLPGRPADDRAPVRPLWHRVVEIAREKAWYAQCHVADTLPGRFDAVTMVLALVLLRMEKSEALIPPSVRLTELFVEDMDGQMRQAGVGDLVVGKHMGKLMGVLGGRLGAFREALGTEDGNVLAQALVRNVTMTEGADAAPLAARVAQLARQLDTLPDEALLAAEIAR